MSSKTRILHHAREIPLDHHFFGQSFVILNYVCNSGLENRVLSCEGYRPDEEQLQKELAKKQFNLDVLFRGYHADVSVYSAALNTEREIEEQKAKIAELTDLAAKAGRTKATNLQGTINQKTQLISGLETRLQIEKEKVSEMLASEGNYFQIIEKELSENPHLVLAYHFFGSDLNTISAVKNYFGSKVKVAVHLHCLPELYFGQNLKSHNSRKRKNVSKFKKLVGDGAVDKFVAVSKAVKSAFVSSGLIPADKITVISNGVSEHLYKPQSEHMKQNFKSEVGLGDVDFVVGYSGRMADYKGVEYMLGILEKYNSQNPTNIGFVFATSNGEERRYFIQKAVEVAPNLVAQGKLKIVLDIAKLTNGDSELNGKVHDYFKKRLEEEGVYNNPIFGGIITKPLQPNVDLYLHPAISEAISLSILEALMSGVPVVASDVGGISQIVNFNNGHLVELKNSSPGGNVCEFVRGIERLASSYYTLEETGEYRKRTRDNLIISGYTAAEMSKQLDLFYSQLVQ